MFAKLKEEWETMDPKFRYVLIGLTICGVIVVSVNAMKEKKSEASSPAQQQLPQAGTTPQVGQAGQPGFDYSVSPNTPRNQGLEQMEVRLQQMEDRINKTMTELAAKQQQGAVNSNPDGAAGSAGSSHPVGNSGNSINLDETLPPKTVNFEQPGKQQIQPSSPASPQSGEQSSPKTKMKVIPSDETKNDVNEEVEEVALSIPVNSGIDGVLLTGFNARPTGSVAGAVGTTGSANDIGAPFVSRLKGMAILPNRWKTAELTDCFIGGNAIAVLSASRAYANSQTISCVAKSGEIYETTVKAYAIDNDGTLGIAGNVVSKQGSLLMQATLTGIASGLGKSLAPTQVPTYNMTSGGSTSQQYQYPPPSFIAGSAVAGGLDQANQQLSKFFMEYAKEIFPVVEVVAGTRVTWIFKETVTLKKRKRV